LVFVVLESSIEEVLEGGGCGLTHIGMEEIWLRDEEWVRGGEKGGKANCFAIDKDSRPRQFPTILALDD